MFPQPSTGYVHALFYISFSPPTICSRPLGAEELLPSLFALGSSTSVFPASDDSGTLLDPNLELGPFLLDIAKRFDKDGLEDVLGGVVRLVAFSPGLAAGMVCVFHIGTRNTLTGAI